ncbi:hypothetical protein AGLY_010853, partial [Aphis glycines]
MLNIKRIPIEYLGQQIKMNCTFFYVHKYSILIFQNSILFPGTSDWGIPLFLKSRLVHCQVISAAFLFVFQLLFFFAVMGSTSLSLFAILTNVLLVTRCSPRSTKTLFRISKECIISSVEVIDTSTFHISCSLFCKSSMKRICDCSFIEIVTSIKCKTIYSDFSSIAGVGEASNNTSNYTFMNYSLHGTGVLAEGSIDRI